MAVHRRIAYTVPAAGAIANVLAGTVAEFIGKASNVEIHGVADVAGDTISLSMTIGGDSKVLIEAGTPLNAATAAGEGPRTDEDGLGVWPVPAGAHLIMGLTGVAAHTGRIAVTVTP